MSLEVNMTPRQENMPTASFLKNKFVQLIDFLSDLKINKSMSLFTLNFDFSFLAQAHMHLSWAIYCFCFQITSIICVLIHGLMILLLSIVINVKAIKWSQYELIYYQ